MPTAAIVCSDDRVLPAVFVDRLARQELVRHLPGSHLPFLSRPGELADLVGEVAAELG